MAAILNSEVRVCIDNCAEALSEPNEETKRQHSPQDVQLWQRLITSYRLDIRKVCNRKAVHDVVYLCLCLNARSEFTVSLHERK